MPYYIDIECRTCGTAWSVEAADRGDLLPEQRHTSDKHLDQCEAANLWIVDEGLRFGGAPRPQVVHSQTIQRLEALGLGTWKFTSEGKLVKQYDHPTITCTCRRRRYHTQLASVTVVLRAVASRDDSWKWEIHREGQASSQTEVQTEDWWIGRLEVAARAAVSRALTCTLPGYEPTDYSPRRHTRSIYGPGMTRCGRSIEDHWEESRIVDDPRKATCNRCIGHELRKHYTPGYETTIQGVAVLRRPVGEGWEVRCTNCGGRLDMADPGGGYVIPFESVLAVVRAHTLPGHPLLDDEAEIDPT